MSQTFLQIVNDVMVALRQDAVTSVNENTLSRLVTLYVNQYKEKVEDACMWRALRHRETLDFGTTALSAAVTNSNERTRLYKIPGKRPRLYDVTNYVADNTQPKDKVWDIDIDRLYEIQESRVQMSYDSASFFALDVNTAATGVDLHRDTKTNTARKVQIEVWTPQAAMDNDSQDTVIKVPTLPIVYGATFQATQERGEELGIDGNEYKNLYIQTLRDAVGKEEGEQGGWEVESDMQRHDILRRQF